ncbi:DUF5362 family protein [Prosthecobacter sp.]|uniref:DUF5362 family protein n=1 Tax=Prosthecobacter sp. TaxID=1965333 RepID=UPI0037848081
METPANPYSAPAANLYGSSPSGLGDAVAASTIAQLAGTKPWLRFMSIIMWLGCAGMGFLSFTYAMIGTVGAAQFENNPAFKGNAALPGGAKFLTYTMLGTSVYMGAIMLLMIYPAMKLWKQANRIGQLEQSRSTVDLDAALTEHRRYWKFNGIMVIIGICLMVVAFIAIFAMAFSSVNSAALR